MWLKVGLIAVHLEEQVVGDLGLGEQDVHVAGHAAGDGVDAEFDFLAVLDEQVGEVAHGVLGLGDGQADSRGR